MAKRHGHREKIITILLMTWLTVPNELEMLRDEGLELLKSVPRRDHLAIHWEMVTAIYPFWSGVAVQVGRLLRLQGSAAVAHVQRRLREQYGDRETVFRAARRVVRSYLDWGVFQETGAKGIYSAGTTLPIDDCQLIAWMAEAALYARASDLAPLKDLLDSPSLFPFRIKLIHPESLVTASCRLDILRHGLDDDLVVLRHGRLHDIWTDHSETRHEEKLTCDFTVRYIKTEIFGWRKCRFLKP